MESGHVILDRDYPIAALVVAVIEQAKAEAQDGDTTARDWLAFDGVLWAEACGMDGNIIKRWIAAGCPKIRNPKDSSAARKTNKARQAQQIAVYA